MYRPDHEDIFCNVTEHANPWAEVPEYTLAVKVLVQAILDATYIPTRKQRENLQQYRNAYGSPEQKHEAMRWLQSDDIRPLSARWIADVVGIDMQRIRLRVEREPRRVREELTQKMWGER